MSKIAKDFFAGCKDRTPEVRESGGKPVLELPVKDALQFIDLPQPAALEQPQYDLTQAIVNRKSLREFSPEKISLAELAYLLWCTQGVKENKEGKVTFRTVPSAGCRHVFNTYLLVQNVEGLKPGLYRYIALEHKLALLNDDAALTGKIADCCVTPMPMKNSAVSFLWTGYIYRMTSRYGIAGMRFMLLDAGHVCQNLYLSALAVGCGACALGGFKDEEINALLGLDEEQHTIYIAAVGKE
ncbi:MAG: SagB/ThcOx family dehydrogenase [Clostridia bacterium]|jgi:SagB-type dehydrogenase family enzyme|nr:SagB/ThcOx family dehydrogenase [Clostridia bacterium]